MFVYFAVTGDALMVPTSETQKYLSRLFYAMQVLSYNISVTSNMLLFEHNILLIGQPPYEEFFENQCFLQFI